MKLFFFILFCAVLSGFVSSTRAERENPYFARTWLAEDGLPDNRVVGLAQTVDGYLWVATQGGAVRFDGARFQRVSIARSPDLIAGTMRGLMLDRTGRVWLAKEEGGTLFCFDGAQVRRVTAEQGLPNNETQRSMAMDGKGDLWVAYSTGKVIRYNQAGKVDAFTARDGLPGGATSAGWPVAGTEDCGLPRAARSGCLARGGSRFWNILVRRRCGLPPRVPVAFGFAQDSKS